MSRTYRKTRSHGPEIRMAPDGRQQHTPQWWSRRRRRCLAAFETETFSPQIQNRKEHTDAR